MRAALLVLLFGLAVAACSPSMLLVQARAAGLAARTLTVVQTTVHDARQRELDACENTLCLEHGELAWRPVGTGFALAHDAITDWIAALALAQAFGTDGELGTAAGLVAAFELAVTTWGALGAALEAHGLALPAIPLLAGAPHE